MKYLPFGFLIALVLAGALYLHFHHTNLLTTPVSSSATSNASQPKATGIGQVAPTPTSVTCSLSSSVVSTANGTQAQLNWTYTDGANAQLNDGLGDAPNATGSELTPPISTAKTYVLTAATGNATSTCSTLADPATVGVSSAK